GGNTIVFTGVSGTMVLTTAELAIADSVFINGPGASTLTINGSKTFRVFNTFPAPSVATITISGLTLTNGKATTGGAISIGDENVTVSNCVVTGNQSTGYGGGIYVQNAAAKLNLIGCTVSNNVSSDRGGGVGVRPNNPTVTVTVRDCTIS